MSNGINLRQRDILHLANSLGGTVRYMDVAKAGSNGKTLDALVQRGLLLKVSERGMNEWRLTAAGRNVIGVPQQ